MAEPWKKNYYAVWLAQFLAIAGFGSINPILPFNIQVLGITDLAEVKLWTGIIQSVDHFWRSLIPDFSVFARSRELPVLIILIAVVQIANSAIVPILPLFMQSLAPEAGMLGTTAGLFLGGTIPSVNALIALKTEEGSHGTVYGLSSSMSAAGFATGPAIAASVAAIAGFPPVFVIISAVLAAAVVMAALFIKKYREEDTEELRYR